VGDNPAFTEFLQRIRAGDDSAAEELVRRYEPLIRREVRVRIEDDRLNRAFDSIDVSQSVLASFFLRATVGQYDLERPEQLLGLLVAMARNKLASRVRQERRRQRGAQARPADGAQLLEQVADPQPSPSESLSLRELRERMRAELTDEERSIADLRSEGLGWEEVARRMGGSSQARRMQLSRGIERVRMLLGLIQV
jgi:RNA polymerase sigma factor (sigma-70 family)